MSLGSGDIGVRNRNQKNTRESIDFAPLFLWTEGETMRTGLPKVLEQLEEAAGGLTDGQLLARFVAARDEPAFAALLRRHGPMVLGVCRRVLRDYHDAEDAFQATFLILARRAVSVAKRASVGCYLYAVAYRAALEAAA